MFPLLSPTSTLLFHCPLPSLLYRLVFTPPAFICVLLPVEANSSYDGLTPDSIPLPPRLLLGLLNLIVKVFLIILNLSSHMH